jgi:LysR family transcriptional regulator, regulator for bpeEF and oprC
MHDLDDVRIFERVVALKSFSTAAKALSLPKSTVSRAVGRLEARVGVRLINRTTREFALTPAGEILAARCTRPLLDLSDAVDYVSDLGQPPRGPLRISCGVAWGYHILADQLPAFVKAYPLIEVRIDVTSRVTDLVGDRVDVAIRMGPIPDSSIVTVRLGSMSRLLCAAPSYLKGRSLPRDPQNLTMHEVIEMQGADGRARTWAFTQQDRLAEVKIRPRIEVNDALAIYRLVKSGVGMGVISNYLCVPDIKTGTLVHVLPDWISPPVDVSLLFPSKRELSPVVRAFVEFMKNANGPDAVWRDHPLPSGPPPLRRQTARHQRR